MAARGLKRSAVLAVRAAILAPKKQSAVFWRKGRTLVTGNTILPFVRPSKEGKRLAFIDGKPTLL